MKTNYKLNTGINTQKVVSKTLAVIISIALTSITLNAQDFNYSLFEKTSFTETNLAMADISTEIRPATHNSDVFVTYTETEETLQLENWMMDENNFSALSMITTESENPIQLESWMTDESHFNTNSAILEVETEETLELESWMTDESNFGNSSIQFTEVSESALELENWMLNDELFSTALNIDQPLALENWMISEQVWK